MLCTVEGCRAGTALHAQLSAERPHPCSAGDEQLARMAADFNASVEAGITWQLYAGQGQEVQGAGMAIQGNSAGL